MGNFCDHHLDVAALNGEAPIQELSSFMLEERASSEVIGRSMSMQSCLSVQKQQFSEIACSEEDYSHHHRRSAGCLLPMDADDSGDENEVDFSQDTKLYAKRTPATYLGRDENGEARYTMISPTKPSCSTSSLGFLDFRIDLALLSSPQIDLARLSAPATPAPTAGSFYAGVPGTAKKTSTPVQPQLPRSNSSYIMTTATVKTLPRSDSSYIYTKAMPRSESSYVNTSTVVRSKSAPPSSNPDRRRLPAPTGPLAEELLVNGRPDPSVAPFRQKVCAALGVSEPARIEGLLGCAGGQNQGMWVLQEARRTLIIKLVDAKRKHRSLATEAEQFSKIAQQHPSICTDPSLAFPIKVFQCRDAAGARHHDLIVMHKAPGRCLAETIAAKWHARQVPQLLQLFEGLGRHLAGFHNQYQVQHGDFQPSNIFYDEATTRFTLIDCGGMETSQFQADGDVEHFGEALRMLSRGLQAQELVTDGSRHFKAGYSAVKR